MCVTLHPLSSFSIRMQKAFLLLFLFLFPSSNVSTRTATPEKKVATSVPAPQKMDGEQLFEDMQLGGVVNFLAFRQAVAGYNLIKQKSKSILTLIDFTKSSTEKRLFVFDMEQKKMLYSSVVSHGKNSGENYATSFSNEVGSYKSSLGFYLTGNTYQGRNGYSLLLDGLEKGIGAGLGIGKATSSAVDAIARQPEAESKISKSLLLGCALAEATAIYGFVIALLIILFLK